MNEKFTSHTSEGNDVPKSSTSGLITLEEMKSRQKDMLQAGYV